LKPPNPQPRAPQAARDLAAARLVQSLLALPVADPASLPRLATALRDLDASQLALERLGLDRQHLTLRTRHTDFLARRLRLLEKEARARDAKANPKPRKGGLSQKTIDEIERAAKLL